MNYKFKYEALINELNIIFNSLEYDELTLRDLVYLEDEINNIFDELKQCKEDIINKRFKETHEYINRGF